MKRRNFLKSASTLAGVPLLLRGVGVSPFGGLKTSPFGKLKTSPFGKSSLLNFLNPDNDRVLVLIQLNGGNDGLNMVLPLDQYDKLSNLRSNILIPESDALQLTTELGLHPVMTGVKSMYDEARLALLQSVGYPNQNRSHFRSTDIWTSASPAEEYWNTGWLGRHLDEDHFGYPTGYPNSDYPDPLAITMGSLVSQTCQGLAANYSMALNDPFSLSLISVGAEDEVPDTPYGWELTFLREAIEQTNAYSDVVLAAAENGSNLATYPESGLANQLRNVALLIAGGLQTKIYVVNLGGFDTHANQVDNGAVTEGNHANLLKELSDAMAAFQLDLNLLGIEERVVGMTFSEFGRQIASNNSDGTDHGTAAPLFVFGSCINPGIIGDNPQIPDPQDIEPQAGVPMQYDFRNIYGSILMDWFEVDEEVVRSLLFEDFQYMPILNPCTPTSSEEPAAWPQAPELAVSPNPFHSSTTLSFYCEQSQYVHLSIYDLRGQELEVLVAKTLSAGAHRINYLPAQLPAGTYACRLQLGNGQAVTRLLNKM